MTSTNIVRRISAGLRLLPAAALAVALGSAGCAVIVVSKPDPGKVVVCHKGKTLEIAEPALDAHLSHGDSRGPCR